MHDPHEYRQAQTPGAVDGKGYAYDHDVEGGFSGDNYWPEEMRPETYYRPTERGFEKRVSERLAWWEERRERK